MTGHDLLRLALEALVLHRLRSVLTLVGIVVGVVAVLVLTALGEGARRYVVDEFSGMGTGVIAVLPGKVETRGAGPVLGGTTRDLTLADATAVARRCRSVRLVAPVSFGTSEFEWGGRLRQIPVIGTAPDYFELRNLEVAAGRAIVDDDLERGESVVVIGRTVQREVFGGANPLGQAVRLGGYRLRVVGVLATKGSSLGIDMDDLVLVPVATAMRMFNQSGLFRILARAVTPEAADAAEEELRRVLVDRHDGEEDFSIITQGAMLATFDSLMATLTAALAGIAAISLAVAGIGIMNVMLVSVSERRGEIGLLKALGARRRQILVLFLAEAVALAGAGAVAGVLLGLVAIQVGVALFPDFPAAPSLTWIGVVVALCLVTGAGMGILPARRAAALDPSESLRHGQV
jgi:putative ABC transport system permease protein